MGYLLRYLMPFIYIDVKSLKKFHVFYTLQYFTASFKARKDAEVSFGSFRCPVLLNLDWNDALGIKVHLPVFQLLVCNRVSYTIADESI